MMKKGEIMTTAKQEQNLALIDAYLEGTLYVSKHTSPPDSQSPVYWILSDNTGMISMLQDSDDVADLLLWIRDHAENMKNLAGYS
jgi:hypothetical protein